MLPHKLWRNEGQGGVELTGKIIELARIVR